MTHDSNLPGRGEGNHLENTLNKTQTNILGKERKVNIMVKQSQGPLKIPISPALIFLLMIERTQP